MGEDEVFQAYRWVYHRGTDMNERQRIELRSNVLSFARAETMGEVEQKMAKRKADLSRLIATSLAPKV